MNSDRLRAGEIERYLTTRLVGRQIFYRDSVGSTNEEAFDLAVGGCPEGTCVVAETQSLGRGRLKRKWHSPYGKNIYLSCVLRPALRPSEVYPLTFISCLAAFDTVSSVGIEPRLKWPNDVLTSDGRKVCGTLLEISAYPDVVRFVVVGVGLNVNMGLDDMEEEIRNRATSLFLETKKRFERAHICGMLLNNLEKYYDIALNRGVGEICRLWEERAGVRGKYMEITQADRVYRGVSQGVAADGALLLLSENGTITRVIAGDVSL
ncbi:MAG: biotin--[acetyl-CoA-carboxylase] ligase [Syntrophorhabdales bacterium]|jgi:BirA family biotin operon repressor/biotin-[acetyl-CoA-carboxylase] ligase